MLTFRRHVLVALVIGSALGTALFVGCNAGVKGGSGGTGGGSGGSINAGGGTPSSQTGTGDTSSISSSGFFDAGDDAAPDVPMNPCGTACGPVELCDGVHKGIDDNCNGIVDEGCPCSPGEAESCFKGDPSYLNTPGCFPGNQKCTENGVWGSCVGGTHATDMCFANMSGCHPISGVPFQTVDVKPGTGSFSNDADPGSGDYSVACPPGVTPCPSIDSMGNVQVLVSGEYTVTYTKTVNGAPDMCTYPLYVGAPGLRVELSWDYPPGGSDNNDLDLHMHEPGDTSDWVQSDNADCGYGNCTVSAFPGGGPNWFPAAPQPMGSPVDWFLYPVQNENTCYFVPRGRGAEWQAIGMGCHNPRLDVDNISCNPAITDPQDENFCNPENINVDFPPKDTWTRIGVHLFGNHGYQQGIHPDVKIYCNGALSADLGNKGFYSPETPIAWGPNQNRIFWKVADVSFPTDACTTGCVVKPLYVNGDSTVREPVTVSEFGGGFGPPYPTTP